MLTTSFHALLDDDGFGLNQFVRNEINRSATAVDHHECIPVLLRKVGLAFVEEVCGTLTYLHIEPSFYVRKGGYGSCLGLRDEGELCLNPHLFVQHARPQVSFSRVRSSAQWPEA